MSKQKRNAIIFGFYCSLMLWLLFNRTGYTEGIPYWEQVAGQLNLIPLRTLRLFAGLLDSPRPEYVRAAVINLVGNIVMFIPLGFLLPRVFPKCSSLPRVLLTTAAIITVVELAQLFTLLGSCDIDDLILNVSGSAVGFAVHCHTNKGLLQNASFAAGLFLCWKSFLGRKIVDTEEFILYSEHSKADREGSHGLAVDNFFIFVCYATFFSE